MAYEEEWETGSGLALDGATVVVTNGEFGFNANMGAGITCLNLTFADLDSGEQIEQSFSAGSKFEANRDGSELVGDGKINNNSNLGLLIESIKGVLAEAGLDPGEVIGNPRVAASWVNPNNAWTFGTVERDVMNPTTKVSKTANKFVVVGYAELEAAEAAPAAKPAARAAKAAPAARAASAGTRVGGARTAAKAAPKASGLPDGVDQELWDQLLELAAQYDEHGEFAEAALELDEVKDSKPAQKAVLGTKPGTVWAAKEAG